MAVIGLIALVLSLGPSFGPRHGQGPPLPYGWLFDHVPLFRAMRVPARLGGLTNLTIVLLAGLGLASTWDRVRANSKLQQFSHRAWAGPALTAVLAAAVLADLWTGAIPIETVDRGADASAAARWLATQPAGPVMEFPAESVFTDPAAASVRRHYGEAMFWSTLHWKPLVNGNSGFIPRAYSDFIERFVGEVERPDGSTTPRISHLDRRHRPALAAAQGALSRLSPRPIPGRLTGPRSHLSWRRWLRTGSSPRPGITVRRRSFSSIRPYPRSNRQPSASSHRR